MKKIKAFAALLLALCFVLAACGKDGNGDISEEKSAAAAQSGEKEVSRYMESIDNSMASEETSAEVKEETSAEISKVVAVPTNDYEPLNYDYMKGMWLYQYSYECLFKEGGEQRDEADYRAKVEKICENLQRDGFNTLFLQVRGHGDSFYPSKLFPPTTFAVKSYKDDFVYDPLKIFCETAHRHKISLHAWINPYRLLLEKQIKKVPGSYVIGKWYKESDGDRVIRVGDRYYLNPAYQEAQQLVIDGAVEICSNYEVDGIHLDDYFYPDGADDGFDSEAYSKLGAGRSLKQFRFDSVNALVKGLYESVHAVNEKLLFGISPAGNIDANRGYLSADVDTWCSEPGYIDYIAPQAYWGFSHIYDYAKYDICEQKWANLIKTDSVKLIMGVGLYRTINPQASDTDPDWYLHKDNIKRMLEHTGSDDRAAGFILFSYESLYDVLTGEYRPDNAEEQECFLPVVKG